MRLLTADIPANLPVYVRADAPIDVPIHRQSVGAMALASGSTMQEHALYVFKPYVYRGKGFDQLTHEVVTVPAPKPRKRKPRKAKPRKPRWDTRPRLHYRPELPHPPYAPATKPKPRQVKWVWEPAEPVLPLAPPPPPKKPRAPARPAAGWKPTSGSDIDDMLKGLED